MKFKKRNGEYGLFFDESIDIIKPTGDLDISKKNFGEARKIGYDQRGLPTTQRPRTVKIIYRQTGTVDLKRKRNALPPGKRISRTGKEYWELRRNRSSLPR